MQFQKIGVSLGSVALVAGAYHYSGWRGVAVAVGMLVMWLLLHFTRMMQVLKRAANRPIGYVDSAVMFNARIQPGMTLLHVVALAKSLGELQSPQDSQPERYRWLDAAQSQVTCEFENGKLKTWELVRPIQTDEAANRPTVSPAP